MKRLYSLLLSLLIFGAVIFGIQHFRHAPTDGVLGVRTQQISSPTPTIAQPSVGIPETLAIPTLGVTATIEQVGQDAEHRMDVPKVPTNVGWYNMGFKPGEKGSAVIDGHYDLVTGAPSVFFNIKNMQNGDKIIVKDNQNHTYTFVVTDKIAYPFDQVPLQQVFNTQDKPRLNLITCSGVWNQAAHNYSHRTVVYAELQSRT